MTTPAALTNPVERRDIRPDLTTLLKQYPSLHAFFASYGGPVMGNETCLPSPDTENLEHFLQIIDWAFKVRDDSLNERFVAAERMKVEGTALLAEVEQQKGLVKTLQMIIDSGAAAGGGGSTKTTSLPHPTPFNGSEPSTSKRTMQFETWRSQINTRWLMRPQEFPNELQRILYAKTMLEGIAYSSVSTGIKKIEANPIDDADWPWKTGNEFIEFLAKKYATHDLIADAENKLSSITQSGKLSVFADFLTEYTNLTDICEWDDAAKVRGFKSKLSQRMRDALMVQALVPGRDEWSRWVELTQRLAVNIEGEDYHKKLTNTFNNGNQGKARDPDAMDVDALKVARLNDEERNRRRAEGLCYKCGQAGHVSKVCPNPVDRSGRGGRGGRGSNGNGNGGNGRGGGAYQQQGYTQGYNDYGQYQQQQQGQGYGQAAPRGNPVRGGYGGRTGGQQGRGNLHVRFATTDNPNQGAVTPGFVIGEVEERSEQGGDYYHTGFHQAEQGKGNLL